MSGSAPALTARQLISRRVAVGAPEERLSDLAAAISLVGAHHCAVVDGSGKFLGLVQLGDVAVYAYAGNRLLADLVSSVQPLTIRAEEPAESVARLFEKHRLCAAAVLSETGAYVGLVTAESVVEFLLADAARKDRSLQQATAELSVARNAQDVFLRSLSHELRTPLNPILILASERATDRTLPADVRDQFEMIAAQTLMEAHLIDALLDLSGLVKGTSRLELKLTSLSMVLEHAMGRDGTGAASPGSVVRIDSPGSELEFLMSDPVKLGRALHHLVKAASDSDGSDKTVRLISRSDPDAKTITLTVTGNGNWLTAIDLANTFSPFPQDGRPAGSAGSRTISPGLAFAHAIIELHAGSIKATSDGPGQGITFTVTLPLVRHRG